MDDAVSIQLCSGCAQMPVASRTSAIVRLARLEFSVPTRRLNCQARFWSHGVTVTGQANEKRSGVVGIDITNAARHFCEVPVGGGDFVATSWT
jgi:hypothetical protein